MALSELLDKALDRRAELVTRLAAEDTDCWRVFHGVAEGAPGLTLDRYGPVVLAQTFREPLTEPEAAELEAWCAARLGAELRFAWNHRGRDFVVDRPDETEQVIREHGARFYLRARHRGQDPWLFLDLRAARRALAGLVDGKSVLNLFAYTCGAGITAACSGATEVWNVDFAASGLDIGKRNAELNQIDPERLRFLHEDALPVLWQLSGQPVKGRASVRPYVRLDARTFDVVFLDPPAWSKGPYGAIDVVRDYTGLFKPALRMLAPGGTIVATNHAAEVELGLWVESLERCAIKIGRPLAKIETLTPDADFPAFDGRAPLKVALCRSA